MFLNINSSSGQNDNDKYIDGLNASNKENSRTKISFFSFNYEIKQGQIGFCLRHLLKVGVNSTLSLDFVRFLNVASE